MLYPNLLYNIFQKIPEKYHLFLRLVSPRCQSISKRLISVEGEIEHYLSPRILTQLVLHRQYIHLSRVIRSRYLNDDLCFKYSCWINDKILLKILMERNNKFYLGKTPTTWDIGLFNACERGYLDLVKILSVKTTCYWEYGLRGAGRGGQPHLENEIGGASSLARSTRQLEIVKFMIQKGAVEWDQGLEYACEGGDRKIVELMIELCEQNYRGENGLLQSCWNNGFVHACLGGNMEIIELMIAKGANCSRNNEHDYYLHPLDLGLRYACRPIWLNKNVSSPVKQNIEIIRFLIKKGAKDFNSGLVEACWMGYLEAVKLMLQMGANNWQEAFEHASRNGNMEIIRLILGIEGFVPNWQGGLHEAFRRGNMDVIQFMIENYLKENPEYLPWNDGLMFACSNGNLELAELMVQFGTGPFDGVSLIYACNEDQIEMIKFLIRNGVKITSDRIYKNYRIFVKRYLEDNLNS